MTKQDSGFKGRMDDCLFTLVEEPSTPPAKQKSGKTSEEEPKENVLQSRSFRQI